MCTKIGIVHNLKPESPSVKNLSQTLGELRDTYDIDVFPLRGDSTSILRNNKYAKSVNSILKSILYYKRIRKYDIIIVHKCLTPVDLPLLEYLFMSCERTVFSTYDAEYIEKPYCTNVLSEHSNKVLATSSRILDVYEGKTSDEKVHLVPPSIDTEFFSPIDNGEGGAKNEYVLGWVGNANSHSIDLEYMVSIFNRIEFNQNVTLRLLGGGDIPDKISSKLEDLNLNIEIIDFVPWEEVPVIINSFDVGLVPLKDTEYNRGRSCEKVREYMACGVPVIGSHVGENPQLIPRETGILCEDISDWENAIGYMRDDEVRSQYGTKAREHIVDNYSTEIVSELLDEKILKRT
ncbi:glycosyltransferase family 4 protein [Natronolimnobius sp. AArcel1]|uniref:glycosyltransferase n=1 Tax=Natronolimnobius sp. AArcel1 TaxID=1679093 RepID=UPI0013EDDFAD|nr:glycosyltransferase [Natronolimnobius sp. AArcel1]NGM69089.1 glycosyltransferase family 4 protein [Natronolimnobius sp. AArcel1]